MPIQTLAALAAKVEALLSDPVARVTQLSIFAESLEYVHSYDPSRCLTHILSDRIRLFAGRLIVLTLKSDSVWVTTDASLQVEHLSALRSWKWDTTSYPRYKRPPSRNGFYTPSDDNDHREWLLIQEAHFSYLDRVLARSHTTHPRSAARHEPLMADYLSTVLRRKVPSPSVSLPGEIPSPILYREGTVERVLVNKFERDRRARDACLRIFGHRCAVCGMSFAERYGPEVEGLIHVHHIVPLSDIREGYTPDPASDLVPVCPNCHAVIHAKKGVTRTIADVQQMLQRAKRKG